MIKPCFSFQFFGKENKKTVQMHLLSAANGLIALSVVWQNVAGHL